MPLPTGWFESFAARIAGVLFHAYWMHFGELFIFYEKGRLIISRVLPLLSLVCEGCEADLWGSYGYHGELQSIERKLIMVQM